MNHIHVPSLDWVSAGNMTQILSIVIDALAKTLLWGPLWSFGLYFASAGLLLIVGSYPGGRAFLETVFSKKEMRELWPTPIMMSSMPKLSNVIPFRQRRKHRPPVEQPMEAAE